MSATEGRPGWRRRAVALTAVLVHGLLATIFWYAFHVRYWKYRDCIHEARSSCISPEGDTLIAGGMLWSVPAALFTVKAIRWLIRAARAR